MLFVIGILVDVISASLGSPPRLYVPVQAGEGTCSASQAQLHDPAPTVEPVNDEIIGIGKLMLGTTVVGWLYRTESGRYYAQAMPNMPAHDQLRAGISPDYDASFKRVSDQEQPPRYSAFSRLAQWPWEDLTLAACGTSDMYDARLRAARYMQRCDKFALDKPPAIGEHFIDRRGRSATIADEAAVLTMQTRNRAEAYIVTTTAGESYLTTLRADTIFARPKAAYEYLGSGLNRAQLFRAAAARVNESKSQFIILRMCFLTPWTRASRR